MLTYKCVLKIKCFNLKSVPLYIDMCEHNFMGPTDDLSVNRNSAKSVRNAND